MIPWTDSVKKTGKLTIFLGPLAGSWGHVFRDALHAFNVLSTANKLGVSFVESKAAPEESGGGANVSVQTANGPVSKTYDHETRSGDFDGKRKHGWTILFSRQPMNTVEKAFIFLPSEPQILTTQKLRAVGPNVMKVMAVHELLHACGLENKDHTSDDLFQGTPRISTGDNAAGDKVLIGVGPKAMPPLYIGGATSQAIKDLWKK